MTPVTLERFRPLVKRTDRLGIRSIEHAAPVAAHVDEAHLEQYPQMLRDRGLLHPQPVHNLPHRALLQGDKVQNLPAPWLCHRIKCIRSCRCPCHASTIHSYIRICQALFSPFRNAHARRPRLRDSDGSSTLSRGEFQWSLFLIGFPGRHAIAVAPFRRSRHLVCRLQLLRVYEFTLRYCRGKVNSPEGSRSFRAVTLPFSMANSQMLSANCGVLNLRPLMGISFWGGPPGKASERPAPG